MAMTDEARQLVDAVARDVQLGRAPGTSALLTVHVAADGTLTVACSCGEDLAHPSGRAAYTMRRVSSHTDLHAAAAAAGVAWDVVQAERQRRVAG